MSISHCPGRARSVETFKAGRFCFTRKVQCLSMLLLFLSSAHSKAHFPTLYPFHFLTLYPIANAPPPGRTPPWNLQSRNPFTTSSPKCCGAHYPPPLLCLLSLLFNVENRSQVPQMEQQLRLLNLISISAQLTKRRPPKLLSQVTHCKATQLRCSTVQNCIYHYGAIYAELIKLTL